LPFLAVEIGIGTIKVE